MFSHITVAGFKFMSSCWWSCLFFKLNFEHMQSNDILWWCQNRYARISCPWASTLFWVDWCPCLYGLKKTNYIYIYSIRNKQLTYWSFANVGHLTLEVNVDFLSVRVILLSWAILQSFWYTTIDEWTSFAASKEEDQWQIVGLVHLMYGTHNQSVAL